ncbi:hypothetical protein OG625_10745 [Streptomyces sp. NBC_01351]|uniref:DUF4190 domain-containing protein n=1 Tax=Streptomyces sp. NBC_01351 TaxID=2903833 RepID=UPI002E366784|nr:hypothetical protein [Streptomyces sp. NBC_01351]
MSENSPEPRDPWAPPERPAVDLGKPHGAYGGAGASGVSGPPSVHDQPTITEMPGAETYQTAPVTGPASAAYGYPAQPDPSAYAYPAPVPAQPTYGYPGQPGYPGYSAYQPYGMPKSNGFGVTALVLGILSVVGCITSFIAVGLGIGAVVFGALGKGKATRGEADNGGMALAGIILGGVGILLGGLMLVLAFSSLRDLGPLPDTRYESPYSDSDNREKV